MACALRVVAPNLQSHKGILAALTGQVAANPNAGVGCDLTTSHFH
jgi:hypothetical protein